jgi:hypothetical protein
VSFFLSSTRRRTSQQTETRKPTRCASPPCSFSCSPSSGPLRRSPGGGRRGSPQARRPRRRLQEKGALVSKVRQKLLRFDLFCFVCCFVHSTLFSSPTSFPPPPYPSKPPHSPKKRDTAASAAGAGGGGFGGGSAAAAAAAAGGKKGGSAASAAAAGGRKMLQLYYANPDLTFSRPLGVVRWRDETTFDGKERERERVSGARRLLTFHSRKIKKTKTFSSSTRNAKTERVPPGRLVLLRPGHREPLHFGVSERAPAHAAADAAAREAAAAAAASAAAAREAAAGLLPRALRGDGDPHGERYLAGADGDLKKKREKKSNKMQ